MLGFSEASPGYVSITADSVPTEVYLDATTVLLGDGPAVVEAAPGKHFVSLFPPSKVYQATYDQAPEHFWERLRALGAVPDRPGLLSSYEAGSVRAGTQWVYVTSEDTTPVRLSRAEVGRIYQRDAGCVMRTFFGWVVLIGAAMVASVMLATLG
ncbi:hypothetical protein FJY69_01160 [candidate division WOR-3 bacterium]|nr:hypothetical protein [candidate division WOR-3 bacterium]